MLRVGSSGKIRACGKGPDNTVRNNCQTQKGASLLTSNFPNFCHHHYRHQHVMVNHQLPGSLFELPPKLSMLFWPEAAFHFALKGRGRGGSGRGRWLEGWVAAEVLSPPLSFADQAGEITATLPQLSPTIPGNEQEATILSLLLRQNFLLASCDR